MIDLRNYEKQIRELIQIADEEDKNWKWSLHSIGKKKCRIRWGYLDYLEEKKNCFELVLDPDDDGTGDWIFAMTPDGEPR